MEALSELKHKRIVKAIVVGALLLVIYAATVLGVNITDGLGSIYSTPPAPGYYRVVEVADGDTFTVIMSGREQEVRLVGVDTPETHHPSKPVQCYGPEASQFTTDLIEGEAIRLEADARQPNRDQYDRLLRYAYLQDGRELNEVLVKRGYALATDFNTEKEQLLKNLQAEARVQQVGLWGTCEVTRQNGYLRTNAL